MVPFNFVQDIRNGDWNPKIRINILIESSPGVMESVIFVKAKNYEKCNIFPLTRSTTILPIFGA